jgi:hypothetical protein
MQAEHPLSWPLGWKREGSRHSSRFGRDLSIASAVQSLEDELARAGARDVVLSTNLVPRLDGYPKSGQAQPADRGVAVYFTRSKKALVLACDRWDRVEANIRAIAKHVEALRGQDRWGVGTLDQAFTAYQALPPQGGTCAPDWRLALGLPAGARPTQEDLRRAYRAQAKVVHPDAGGSPEAFIALQRALELALQEIGCASSS